MPVQNPKRILQLVMAGFILFNLVLIALVLKPRHIPPASLPDGSRVEYLQTSYGTNHFCGSILARMVSATPPKVQNFLKRVLGNKALPREQFSTPETNLVVFYEITPTNMLPAPPLFSRHPLQELRAMLADESGTPSGATKELSKNLSWSLPQSTTVPFTPAMIFHVFPRRAETIQMLIVEPESNSVKTFSRLTIPNPVHKAYPVWTPEPLPATRHFGDMDFSLLAFDSQAINLLPTMPPALQTLYKIARPVDRLGFCAFKLKVAPARPHTQYLLTGLTLGDPTGNSLSKKYDYLYFDYVIDNDGILNCTFTPALWPDEPAWKLTLTVESYFFDKSLPPDTNHVLQFLVKPRP